MPEAAGAVGGAAEPKPRVVREQQRFTAAPIPEDGGEGGLKLGGGKASRAHFLVDGELQIDAGYFGSQDSNDDFTNANTGGGSAAGAAGGFAGVPGSRRQAAASGPAHGPLGFETLVLNFNAKRQRTLDKERKTQVLQFVKGGGASDLRGSAALSAESDLGDEEDEDDDDGAGGEDEDDGGGGHGVGSAAWQLEHPVWMEGGVARVSDGRALRVVLQAEIGRGSDFGDDGASSSDSDSPLPALACCVTGQALGSGDAEDFVCVRRPSLGAANQLFDFYSRAGFLAHYGELVDAATLQVVLETAR